MRDGWFTMVGGRSAVCSSSCGILYSRLGFLLITRESPRVTWCVFCSYQLPIKTLFIDGNCRVEDRGLKIHNGHMVYVLCVYNKKDKYHRIMMAAFNIQEALIWKEKFESQALNIANGNMVHASFLAKVGIGGDKNASSSDRESLASAEDEEKNKRSLIHRTTIGNGFREWFSEADDTHTVPRILVMMSIASGTISSKKGRKGQDNSNQSGPLDQLLLPVTFCAIGRRIRGRLPKS